jgi:lysophospholipase L1-like esterase
MVPLRGQFREVYRAIKRKPALAATTPVIFCEGDSWFSTPLSMNMLDWIVYPTPEDEAQGVPLFGSGGLFFRAERSGELATEIFTAKRVKRLLGWFSGSDFDLVIVSAGGNDFVGTFLERTFAGASRMTPAQAFARVEDTGRFEDVRKAYARLIAAFRKAKPTVPILCHTYDYPIRLGQSAQLTAANLGAFALFKRSIGPWIAPQVARALPEPEQQRQFARLLIDGFVDSVLKPLRADPILGTVFDFVDLRETLPDTTLWFDEMHPTGTGFHLLADKWRQAVAARLPPAKR